MLLKLRIKLLEEGKITLDKVKTISRTLELRKKHLKRMEARENSQLAAGVNNEEINHVLHQSGRYKNQGAGPKQHNQGTKPTYQRKPVDRQP